MSSGQLSSASVDNDFLSILQEKYNILNVFVLKNYDQNLEDLRKHLTHLRKDKFNPKDRIIVVQFDTDYYIDERVGINLINLFNIWREVDIPMSVMIYYTNNFGVSKEIDYICRYNHVADRPTVIETFFNPLTFNKTNYPYDMNLDEDLITHHCLCMIGNNRSHRFALYNHIKHLLDRIVCTIKGLNK